MFAPSITCTFPPLAPPLSCTLDAESFLHCCLFFVLFFFAEQPDGCRHLQSSTPVGGARALTHAHVTVSMLGHGLERVGAFPKVAPERPIASVQRSHVTTLTRLFLDLRGCRERKQSSADSSAARYLSLFGVMLSSASRFLDFYVFGTKTPNTSSVATSVSGNQRTG